MRGEATTSQGKQEVGGMRGNVQPVSMLRGSGMSRGSGAMGGHATTNWGEQIALQGSSLPLSFVLGKRGDKLNG